MKKKKQVAMSHNENYTNLMLKISNGRQRLLSAPVFSTHFDKNCFSSVDPACSYHEQLQQDEEG